jgi:predicted CoA-binding protein
MRVAVLGASKKPERYSNRAVKLLKAAGHMVYPVNPALTEIEGLPVYQRLTDITGPLDTVTVYMSRERSNALAQDFLAVKPRRVIFNPGAENPALARQLREAGIHVENACTLVLLQTDQF